jgi:hypothetical protein
MTGPTLLVGVLVILHLAVVLQGIPTLPNGQKIQGELMHVVPRTDNPGFLCTAAAAAM